VTDRAPVHVQTLMEEIVAMLASTLPAGVDLQAQLDAGDAAVLGDATQLYQVAMNICTNAVQAIEGAGTVSIRLQRDDVSAPRVLLHTELAVGPHVCLEVRDTGVGIPPEALQRIFEPFFTTKKQGEGTGLGLAVVHGIVADLGGAIDVASVPGEGTQVSVWLPVCGECAPATVPDAGEWPAGQGEVVMVVDDEHALVELAEETLAGLGYEPVGFDSAERALQAFEADPGRFDALLSDEMLPGMPGTELARLLRARLPALPVLLMSGKVNEAMIERAQAAGVHAVLHKPLALRELATRLAEALSGRYS
jgi:CheY-like chemotaxis protein/two-component sensor histidine kinase